MVSTERSAQQSINWPASCSLRSSPAKTGEMQICVWVCLVFDSIFLCFIRLEPMFPQEEISIFWDELPCFEIDKVWEIVQKLSERKRKQIKTIHRGTIP